MKRKDLDTAKSQTVAELVKRIAGIEFSLAATSRERYTKQSKNVRECKRLRIDIAQLKTILREKELLA